MSYWTNVGGDRLCKEDEKEGTALDKKNATIITEGEAIGTIKIESIGIRCPVIAGTNDGVLNKGIGYLMETAPIRSVGNCVLAGHNGSHTESSLQIWTK